MTLLLVTYLAGVLTILSPCILPILPFVLAPAGRPFFSNTLPMLAGMAVTFATIATFATVGGGWVVQANAYGRIASMALLAIFCITLIFPSLSDLLTRPVVAIGNRLSASADADSADRPRAFPRCGRYFPTRNVVPLSEG